MTDLAKPTEQRADEIAGELEAALARAREHQANVERADELALRLAAHEAGVPLEHPVAEQCPTAAGSPESEALEACARCPVTEECRQAASGSAWSRWRDR